MRTILKTAAALVALSTATGAMAAPTITSVAVTGTTYQPQTVWNTAKDSFYAVFVSRPYGTVLNPTDNFSGAALINPVSDDYGFTLAGDGFPVQKQAGANPYPNSDPVYTLTLNLVDGSDTGTLTGTYTEATGQFLETSGPFVSSSGSFSLTDFNWARGGSNTVGAYSTTDTAYDKNTQPGSGKDYQGQFTVTVAAVPEPATWALMILGFGMVGGALRSRRARKMDVAFA